MTEDEVRDLTMKVLFTRFGKPESWRGDGKSAAFDFVRPNSAGAFAAERKLDYALPGGKIIAHCSDILATIACRPLQGDSQRFISIEIKHTSAVTDQFKCRAFDMTHLKQQLGERVFGIMFFARAGQGIGLDQARAISYPFDDYVGVDLLSTPQEEWFGKLVASVEGGLNRLANIGLQPMAVGST